jgi:hypothetical protein
MAIDMKALRSKPLVRFCSFTRANSIIGTATDNNCHHRHNGRCLASKIERCDMSLSYDLDGKLKTTESAVDSATRIERDRCLKAVEEVRIKYKKHSDAYAVSWWACCDYIKARIEADK